MPNNAILEDPEIVQRPVIKKTSPGKVLIIDDDQDVLDSLKDLLKIEGKYDVEMANDINSVKRKLYHFKPDIALIDIRLGNYSGLDLIPLLKTKSSNIDCIMITAHREVDYAVKALRYGATDYLFKPIDSYRLLRTMENYFRQRRVKEEKLYKERHIKTILEEASGFIFLLNPEGNCVEANRAALSYIDQKRDTIIGTPVWETPWWQHSIVVGKQLQNAIKAASLGEPSRLEIEVADHKGNTSWFEFFIKAVFEKDKNVSLIIAEGHDLAERKQIEQDLKRMALYDPLTGLANRTLLYEHLESTLAHSARYKLHFSVLFIDLDHFKKINDSMGHDAGDKLLINIGDCFRSCLRDEDIIARVGGDEFVIVLNSESDIKKTKFAVKRITTSINKLTIKEGHNDIISASVGIAVYPADGGTTDALLSNADKAMYKAKKKGRNCYQFYSGH